MTDRPEQNAAIMGRLKDETAVAHARVDALMDLPAMTADRYCQSLAALRDAHRAVELACERHATALGEYGYDVAARSKLDWLDADLSALKAAVTPAQHAIHLGDPAQAFGAIYVMEGSTLGGQVIARHVMPALGLTAGRGCRYFAGYGAETGTRWRETAGAITRYATAHPDEADRMIAGANATFALVETTLRSRLGQ